MRFLKRSDVRLAFEDNNAALPPMLLVHGCGLDHCSLTKIADFFSKSYRVISVDLRGHGRSDAPYQEYTVPAFADDLAWLCAELTLPKVIVVGHSMGGNVALELAARHSELVSMIVMIDSIMLPSEAMLEAHRSNVAEILGAPAYLEAYKPFKNVYSL